MIKKSNQSRREFIKKSAIASSSLLFPTAPLFSNINSLKNNLPNIFLFSKQLQFLGYNDMCKVTKEMGFNGVDLTVRPKGHVLPENVAYDLPIATETMKLHDLTPQLITTNISNIQNAIDVLVLKTVSKLGYQLYRPAWYKYKNETTILDTVENVKNKLKNLEILNTEFNINMGYQNHSGHYFGAPIWDLHQTLKEIKTKNSGCQYDIMHATVEGGKNWEIGFHLIKPYINSIVVKDYIWKKINDKWVVKYVPLGEGMVNFTHFFSLLKKNAINVPLCLHAEYDLGGAEHGLKPTIPYTKVYKKLHQDINFIKEKWASTL